MGSPLPLSLQRNRQGRSSTGVDATDLPTAPNTLFPAGASSKSHQVTKKEGTTGLLSNPVQGPSVIILTSFQLSPQNCLTSTTITLFLSPLNIHFSASDQNSVISKPSQTVISSQSAMPSINEPSGNEDPFNKDTIKNKAEKTTHGP